MSTFVALPVVIVFFVLFPALGCLVPVFFGRRHCGTGSGAALGCLWLGLGGMLFCFVLIVFMSGLYISLHSRHTPGPVSAVRPMPSQPAEVGPRAGYNRAVPEMGETSAAGQKARSDSALPSPADQPPKTADNPAQPTQLAANQQNQSSRPNEPDASVNSPSGEIREKLPTSEGGTSAEVGSTNKANSKATAGSNPNTAGSDPNAESADLISRAMARGIKAALEFLAKEGVLDKDNAREHPSGAVSSASSQQPAAANQTGSQPGSLPPRPSTAKDSPSTPDGKSKPNTSQQRPAWVDMPLQRIADGHQMALRIGPCFSSDECRSSLPDELQKAAIRYARECLQLDLGGSIRMDPEVLQEKLVRETWEETIDTSVGPTVWLHVLVEFDRRARGVIEQSCRRMVIERRVKAVGAILGCTLLLLGVVYTGLRVDERLAGRFRLLTIAACLLATGAIGAGALGLLRYVAHGG